MKSNKKIAAGILALCMLAGFTGCSEISTTSSQGDAASPVQSSSAAQQTENLKGEVALYTSQPEQDVQALIEAFSQKQPNVKVNVLRSGTEGVVSKILAEKKAGAVKADLFLVADAAAFETLKSEDLLMSYESPGLKGISSDYYDAEHTYTDTKIISTEITVNTDMVKQAPVSYKDLIDAAYKDNLIVSNPLYSGAAAHDLDVLARADGVGQDFCKSLKASEVSVQQGDGAVEKAMLAGWRPCGIVIDYLPLRDKAKGSPVEFIYPSEGSLGVIEPIGIVSGTPNEAQAKAFVDFILFDDGQTTTSVIEYTPVKSGIRAPKGFKSVDKVENLTYDIPELVKTRDGDKEEFSKLFGQKPGECM